MGLLYAAIIEIFQFMCKLWLRLKCSYVVSSIALFYFNSKYSCSIARRHGLFDQRLGDSAVSSVDMVVKNTSFPSANVSVFGGRV